MIPIQQQSGSAGFRAAGVSWLSVFGSSLYGTVRCTHLFFSRTRYSRRLRTSKTSENSRTEELWLHKVRNARIHLAVVWQPKAANIAASSAKPWKRHLTSSALARTRAARARSYNYLQRFFPRGVSGQEHRLDCLLQLARQSFGQQ